MMLDMLSVVPEIDNLVMGANTDHWYDVTWNPNMNGGEFQIYDHEGDHTVYYKCKTASEVIEIVKAPNQMYEVNWDSIEEVPAIDIHIAFEDVNLWDSDIDYCNNLIRGYVKYLEGNEEMASDILELLHQREFTELNNKTILNTITDYLHR